MPSEKFGAVGESFSLVTASDSAAAMARPNQTGRDQVVSAAVATTISLRAGDRISVVVQSTDCTGDPETVNVSGVISGLVASGSCPGMVGTQVTLGPATANGTISFRATHSTYGVGPAGQVSGSGGSYTVGMNDGYPGDTDYNDVILSVSIICPPSNDPVLDHPDFKVRFDSLMKLSNISGPVGSRQEWAFNVYSDASAPNGIRLGQPLFSGAECGMDMPAPVDPTIIAVVHSHPHFKGDNMNIACGKTNADKYDPGVNGGGSDQDWAYQRQFGIDVYAVSPERTHLLPRGSVVPLTPNPYKWKRTANACWIP